MMPPPKEEEEDIDCNPAVRESPPLEDESPAPRVLVFWLTVESFVTMEGIGVKKKGVELHVLFVFNFPL